MRTAFIEELLGCAGKRSDVMLLTADLGFSVLERFRDALPKQYLNVGVAEQNMMGVAAGLAHLGKVVFTYSIANFPTLRCFEQVRNDVCYHRLPVRVVAVGGGFTYSTQGYTHHGVEDIGVMRTLPGMTVIAPGDPHEAMLATRALCDLPGPAYLRLGKAGEPKVHASIPADFRIGKALTLCEGGDLTLISTGGMLRHTVDVAELLRAKDGVKARVLSMHTVKPLDVEAVARAAEETGAIITVEEHNVSSGLASVVAQALATLPGRKPLFHAHGVPDEPYSRSGSLEHMREMMGDLRRSALELVRRK
jgi:transketolase